MPNSLVGDAGDWVELFSGDEATAVVIRTRLESAAIASRLDQPIIGSSDRAFSMSVYVQGAKEVLARGIIADLLAAAPSAAALSHDRSETTRLLCGTALVKRGYRRQILELFDNETRAIPPELGADIGLLVGVARWMEKRARNYELGFTAAMFVYWALSAVILLIASSSPGAGVFLVSLAAATVYFVVVWVAFFRKIFEEKWKLPESFTRRNFDPARVRERFGAPMENDEALPRADQNVVIYSGFTPFAGAGVETGGWSYVVDTSRPQAESGAVATKPFAPSDLYDAVITAIRKLGLPQVEIRDFVFLSGRDIRDDREVLPRIDRRPVQIVDREYVNRLRTANRGNHARWYPWIRIYDWNNEVVVSQFLRFHKERSHLFVELKRYALPPLHDGFRSVDGRAPRTNLRVFGLAVGTFILAWFVPLVAALMLLARIATALQHRSERKQRRKLIADNPAFDYGTYGSIRQAATNGRYSHYFQFIDATMINQMLEGEILNTIVEFLEDHDIDTSDVKDRRTMILNSGIIVHGGDVNAQALAVGQQATATQNAAKKTTFSGLRREGPSAPSG